MKRILWLLTPLAWSLCFVLDGLLAGSGSANLILAEPISTTMMILMGLGGLLGAGGSILGGMQAGKGAQASFSEIDRANKRRPYEFSEADRQIFMQTALQMGAPPDQIARSMLEAEVGANYTTGTGRIISSEMDKVDQRLLAGDQAGAKKVLDRLNKRLRYGYAAAPAVLRISGNKLVVDYAGSTGQQLQQLRQAGDVFGSRMEATKSLGDIMRGEVSGGLPQLALNALKSQYGKERDTLLQRANVAGYRPELTLAALGQYEPERTLSALQGSAGLLSGLLQPANYSQYNDVMNRMMGSQTTGLSAGLSALGMAQQGAQTGSSAQGSGIGSVPGEAFGGGLGMLELLKMMGGGGPGAGSLTGVNAATGTGAGASLFQSLGPLLGGII